MKFQELNRAMLDEFQGSPEIYHPSAYWKELNSINNKQIDELGIENFKRTVVKNYFTWMRVWPWDSQIRFMVKNIGAPATLKSIFSTFFPLKHQYIKIPESLALNALTNLSWRYVEQSYPELMAKISEPIAGNPPRIYINKRLVSQDIANSIIEFGSMNEGDAIIKSRIICELGGGYGRNAYVVMEIHPKCKYMMVDIPPALAVAQTYLSDVYPDKKIFHFRKFDKFEDVKEELEDSDIIFLLPHQMSMLPDNYVHYFLNISSLHEMGKRQIDFYLDEIYRLVRPGGHFYFKAWKKSKIPFDDIVVLAEDYDLDRWNALYHRTARIQTLFFETLLQKPA